MARNHPRQMRSARTPSDVTVLLLELDRALRSQIFYPEGNTERREALDRGWRTWQADLERHGPLALELREGCFWLAGTEIVVGRGRLDELARELAARGIDCLRWTRPLDAEAFARFVRSLGPESGDRGAAGLESAPSPALGEPAVAPPPELAAREGSNPEEATEHESPSPLDPGRALGALLRELEALGEGDPLYDDLCEQVVGLARTLLEQGKLRACLTVARVLCVHAGDDEKRSPEQQGTAERALRELVQGPLRREILDRAASRHGEARLEAAQILLQLGSATAPDVIEAIRAEGDPARRRRLSEVLVALADLALPALVHRIEHEDDREGARLATRLAGECQHPDAVAPLQRLAGRARGPLRRDAIRALGQIASASAVAALADGLRDANPAAARALMSALASTGRTQAVAPLARQVERSLRSRSPKLGLEAIRALGQLGVPDAIGTLGNLLARHSLRHRRRLREIQLAGVATLARLSGSGVADALATGTRARDARVRRAANLALQRADRARELA